MQKIIFLDVDGVLTTSRCLLGDFHDDDETLCCSWRLLSPSESGNERIVPLEINMIQNLKYIIDETKAKIVISSTWRENDTMTDFLLKALESQGILTSDCVIGMTSSLGCLAGRGAEIRLWLNENEWSNFVILDDDHMRSFQDHSLQDRVVPTLIRDDDRSKEGLTREKSEMAISILLNSSLSL